MKRFTENLSLTKEDQSIIPQNTTGQSSVPEWTEQRKGRLTANRFHQICTRTKTLQETSSKDASCLLSSLLGYKEMPNTASIKHGCAMEPHAKAYYLSVTKKKHKKLTSSEAGLVVMEEKPYIAVLPDLQIECICCGKGFVEVKCPYSIRDTVPSAKNLKYLEMIGKKVVLKKNSNYYYQIQGQMGVTGRSYTDLLIFTSHGNIIQRVMFDKSFWLSMLNKLEWFWNECLCPELLLENIKKEHLLSQATPNQKSNTVSSPNCYQQSGKNNPASLSSPTGFHLVSSTCTGKASTSSPKNPVTSNSTTYLTCAACVSLQSLSNKKKRSVKNESRKNQRSVTLTNLLFLKSQFIFVESAIRIVLIGQKNSLKKVLLVMGVPYGTILYVLG